MSELRFWRGVAALSVAGMLAVVYVYARLHNEPETLVSRKCEPELSESAQVLLSDVANASAAALPLRQSLILARVPRVPAAMAADPPAILASAASAGPVASAPGQSVIGAAQGPSSRASGAR